MRTAILLVLAILCITCPAVSQPADDKLIVPGVRIGKWTLKMTFDEMEKMNGPTSVSHGLFWPDFRGETFFYVWRSLDFGVAAYEPRKVGWFVVCFGGFVPWRTEKGIGLQSTRANILKAYGKPTVETVPFQGQKNMIYDAIGIDFQVHDPGAIREIRIFRSGTAKSIWKL